jgi:hypothetical protein
MTHSQPDSNTQTNQIRAQMFRVIQALSYSPNITLEKQPRNQISMTGVRKNCRIIKEQHVAPHTN